MKPLKISCKGLLAAFVTAFAASWMGSAAGAEPAEPAEPKMVLTPGERSVLDFSDSRDQGVPGGSFFNFAFSLDASEPMRKITYQYGEQRKDFIATYDFADCSRGQEGLLEKPVQELARGMPSWVDYVDVEMMPMVQKGVGWSGGVCYGYRKPSGAWHWRLTSTPLTYDPATNRVRARIWVKEGGIDAMKLVFDQSVPRHSVRKVTITTQPDGGGAAK